MPCQTRQQAFTPPAPPSPGAASPAARRPSSPPRAGSSPAVPAPSWRPPRPGGVSPPRGAATQDKTTQAHGFVWHGMAPNGKAWYVMECDVMVRFSVVWEAFVLLTAPQHMTRQGNDHCGTVSCGMAPNDMVLHDMAWDGIPWNGTAGCDGVWRQQHTVTAGRDTTKIESTYYSTRHNLAWRGKRITSPRTHGKERPRGRGQKP